MFCPVLVHVAFLYPHYYESFLVLPYVNNKMTSSRIPLFVNARTKGGLDTSLLIKELSGDIRRLLSFYTGHVEDA